MRIWYDIEQDTIVTEAQLYGEHCAARESDPNNEVGHRDLTFEEIHPHLPDHRERHPGSSQIKMPSGTQPH